MRILRTLRLLHSLRFESVRVCVHKFIDVVWFISRKQPTNNDVLFLVVIFLLLWRTCLQFLQTK